MTTAAPPDLHLDDDLVTEFAQAPRTDDLLASSPHQRGRMGRLVLGSTSDAPWVRPSLIALLASTAVLYIWGLGASGWANSFYSAAVQAGTKSWKAMFYGSFDSSNFITVDKPPASLWVMVMSARIFGVNAGSILVPQALEGVAAVGVLYAAVRRWFTPGAGLLAGTGRWGATGWYRMFNSQFGSQVSWLIPASLLLLASGLIATGRAPRTDRTRAALILWGGWLLVTDVVLSFGRGIIHPYYTVALGPAIGAVVAIGATYCWARRSSILHRVVLALAIAGSAWWSYVLLTRTPNWNPWVRYAVLVVGTVAAVVLVAWKTIGRRAAIVVVGSALASMLAAPFAYSVATAATAKSGVIPSAGPTVAGGFGGAPPRSSRHFRPTPGTTPGWRRPSEPIRPPASRSVPVTL